MPPTNYYVRPTNGNNIAGQGLAHGTAYQTTQFAFDDIGVTHGVDAVNGDQVNVCGAGGEGADVLAASLNLVLYGAVPGAVAPLIIRGYTAAANDGGVGDISGGAGGFTIMAGAPHYVHFVDMHLHNVGNASVLVLGNSVVAHCEIDTTTAVAGVVAGLGTAGILIGCYLHHPAGNITSNTNMVGCYLEDSGASVVGAFYSLLRAVYVEDNIFYLTHVGSLGIYLYNSMDYLIRHNAIYQGAAGTAYGIRTANNVNVNDNIYNNIIS